jgi:hypothetical protein
MKPLVVAVALSLALAVPAAGAERHISPLTPPALRDGDVVLLCDTPRADGPVSVRAVFVLKDLVPSLVSIAPETVSAEARDGWWKSVSSKLFEGKGTYDRSYWLWFAGAGVASVFDAVTTWDATARRMVGIEGNPLFADDLGHPNFGVITGVKLAGLGTSLVTRRKWPRFSKGLLVGITVGSTAASISNASLKAH